MSAFFRSSLEMTSSFRVLLAAAVWPAARKLSSKVRIVSQSIGIYSKSAVLDRLCRSSSPLKSFAKVIHSSGPQPEVRGP
jgi:hypothetical protein